MGKALTYLDYFFIMRPTLFFPVWTVFLAGYYANQCFDTNQVVSGNHPVLVLVLLSLLMGAVFIFNQIVDIETDAKNQKLFFIAKGIISKSTAKAEGIILTIFPIAAAFFLNAKLGIIFIVIFLWTGIVYSLKPFSWKDRPILGIVTNFFGGWSVAACGWISAGTDNWLFVIYAIPYAVGLVAVFLLTTIPDIPGDRESQKITFGVKFGQQITIYWALGFEFLTIVLSFILGDDIIFFPALASFPLFVVASIRQRLADVVRAVKFTVLFASLAVCVVYPIYFGVLLFTYFFSKWYYKKRFNLEYPKFAA